MVGARGRRRLTDINAANGHWVAGIIVMAYEPVCAIGTGRVATAEVAQDMTAHFRGVLTASSDDQASTNTAPVKLVNKGSGKPTNIASLMSQIDINRPLIRRGQLAR